MNWVFYKHTNSFSTYCIYAANDKIGNYLSSNGDTYNTWDCFNKDKIMSAAWIPCNLETALSLLDEKGKKVLMEKVGYNNYKLIDFTNAEKNRVINKLKKKRAFNGDSAHLFKIENDERFADVLYSMVTKGLIKQIERKYYLNE